MKFKERPILFSAPMVRAILDGSKTQTRRAFSEKLKFKLDCAARIGEVSFFVDEQRLGKNDLGYVLDFCPYGQAGDRLWVRETHYEKGEWRRQDWPDADDFYWAGHGEYLYAATDEKPKNGYRTWPSIHMKRKASRILLEIVSVRVERLNDISEEDAQAEGIELVGGAASVSPWRNYRKGEPGEMNLHCSTPQRSFMTLWESINGDGSWQTNPWVWVIEFKRVEQ